MTAVPLSGYRTRLTGLLGYLSFQFADNLPRLNCNASLFQASARMRLSQFMKLGKEVSLGEEGRRRGYSPADLAGEYTVRYRFHTTSQEQLASAAAIAVSLGDLVDEKFKLEEILQLSNPAEMMERRREEAMLKASPARRMFREVMGLIEKRDRTRSFQHKRELDIEAHLQLRQLISVLKQGDVSPEDAPKQKPERVLPVFSKGKGEESARTERLSDKRRGNAAG